jgi:valyl-tRNA synthetase
MNAAGAVAHHGEIFRQLAKVQDVRLGPTTYEKSRSEANFDVAIDYEATIDIPAERERLTKDILKYEKGLAAAERQLGNDAFLSKAPAHVVEGLKKQEAETRLLLEKAQAALKALPKE